MKPLKKRFIICIIIWMCMYIGLILSVKQNIQIKIIYDEFETDKYNQNAVTEVTSPGMESESSVISPVFPKMETWWKYEVIYNMPQEQLDSLNIKLLMLEDKKSRFKSIEVYNNGLQVAKYAPLQLLELFEFGAEATHESPFLVLTGDEEVLWMKASPEFINQYNAAISTHTKEYINITVLMAVLLIICIVVNCKLNTENKKNISVKYTKEDYVLGALLTLIFVSAVVMALKSPLYSHCDESYYRMGIDYYLGKWNMPYEDSNWMAGTFSRYGGFARALEYTLYYLFAGKIGWIARYLFNIETYYRISNLISFLIMMIICWKYRNKHKWMFMAIGLSPMIWYLFSYATSDAWDYMWCFLVLWLLLDNDSTLNKLINNEGSKKQQLLYIGVSSVVFTMLLLAKSNYFPVLGIAFIDLLFKLLKKYKNKKEAILLLGKYMLILLLAFGIVWARKHMVILNGEHESVISGTNYTMPDYVNQLTDAEKGISLYDFMFNTKNISPIRFVLTSMIGTYFWHSFWSGPVYILLMVLAYFLQGIFWVKQLFCEKSIETRIKMLILPVWFTVMFAITILYCYYVTYQPQGRYVLPVYIAVAYSFAASDKLLNNKYVRWLQYICAVLGLYSFWFVGIAEII